VRLVALLQLINSPLLRQITETTPQTTSDSKSSRNFVDMAVVDDMQCVITMTVACSPLHDTPQWCCLLSRSPTVLTRDMLYSIHVACVHEKAFKTTGLQGPQVGCNWFRNLSNAGYDPTEHRQQTGVCLDTFESSDCRFISWIWSFFVIVVIIRITRYQVTVISSGDVPLRRCQTKQAKQRTMSEDQDNVYRTSLLMLLMTPPLNPATTIIGY